MPTETLQTKNTEQEYAHSTATIWQWGGGLALDGMVSAEQLASYEKLAFDDFSSALREMLRTDVDFKSELDVDDDREHKVINGQVRAQDGQVMVDVIRRGKDTAQAMARSFPEFEGEAIRAEGDEIVARIVDQLRPGQAYITRSTAPRHLLKLYPKVYRDLGYREDIDYDQYYVKVDEHTVIAGSYSTGDSGENSYRRQRAAMGVPLPETADENTIIRHGFVMDATPEEAKRLVLELRGPSRRVSVSEYVAQNQTLVRNLFDSYYPALAQAEFRGTNNPVMRQFAETVRQADIRRLDPKIRQAINRVAESESFDSEAARAMDSVIRYAVVEELRKGLKNFVNGQPSLLKPAVWPSESPWRNSTIPGVGVNYNIYHSNKLLTANLSAGINAGRSYGGCAAVDIETENESSLLSGSFSPQDSYGGRGKGSGSREEWKTKKGRCAISSCPTRPGEVTVGPCDVCMERCQKLYDQGKDPIKMGSVMRKAGTVVSTEMRPTAAVKGSNSSGDKVSYRYN